MTTRPYRPSNGTEGVIFDDEFCSNCQHDAAWREDERAEPCDILSRTFFYNIDDPQYPTEWVEDDVQWPEDSKPRCTAFVPIGETPSSYVRDERQGELEL
jgi:hypothetical protein